jgi:hypothetical protein
VSENAGPTPIPYALDVSVVTALTRGDAGVTALILGYDAARQPLVIPVLVMTAALLDLGGSQARDVLEGLGRLDMVLVAPLTSLDQAARLAVVITRTSLDPGEAHAASVADASICPILTLNGAKWRQHAGDLDETLHIIEIADPG